MTGMKHSPSASVFPVAKDPAKPPPHTHTQTKAVLNRMARLIGHMQSIRRMVEEGRDCSDILLQISAVDAALRGVGKIILKDHMEHCIVEAVHENDHEALARLGKAIDQFMH